MVFLLPREMSCLLSHEMVMRARANGAEKELKPLNLIDLASLRLKRNQKERRIPGPTL
jgi:hypothetical protein